MDHTYIIGEIGQNHNGSIEIGKQIIDIAAQPVFDEFHKQKLEGVDAIKLTKRDLNEELSAEAWAKPYTSKHSFGATYGEHRKKLELSDEEHYELFQYAKSKNLDVVETLCAIGTLSLFRYFQPDYIKVASRDLANLPLLEALSETGIPMILSTGMSGKKELGDAIDVISQNHEKITVLHCLSQYPSDYDQINLLTISYLIEAYPNLRIGYSDHSIGIVVPAVAVSMGARVIEKHITLDRDMKGTDHAGSLGPDGLYRMVRDIRNIEKSMGEKDMFLSEAVKESKVKLERSIASKRELKQGEKIEFTDIHLLSPGDGFSWTEKSKVIGKKLKKSIGKDQIIYQDFIQEDEN